MPGEGGRADLEALALFLADAPVVAGGVEDFAGHDLGGDRRQSFEGVA
ncbi:MAG: hypothetical protein ACI9R3_001754 [Verrucomicrobiales bacterium]